MTDSGPSPDRQPGRPPGGAGSDGEDDRTLTNIVLLIGFLVLIGSGIWIVDAMLDARRADECISAGRRNCGTLPVVPPPR